MHLLTGGNRAAPGRVFICGTWVTSIHPPVSTPRTELTPTYTMHARYKNHEDLHAPCGIRPLLALERALQKSRPAAVLIVLTDRGGQVSTAQSPSASDSRRLATYLV